MTEKEKGYLLEMMYNNFNRSEIEYSNYLYRINSRVDEITLINALISYIKTKTQSKMLRDTIALLKCSQFDDDKPYKSKSERILLNRNLSKEQDDLIYSYILFVLNNKE